MHLEICITIVSRVLQSSQGTGHYLSPKAGGGGAEDLGLDKVKFSRSPL